MTRHQIAKEIERREKTLAQLTWVAGSKLTASHQITLDKEIAAERRALAQLTQAWQEAQR